MAAAVAYREPATLTILIQSSFLLVLNIINYLLDRAIYCGLVGQIFVGVAWGTPGGKLLGDGAETLVTQLGYLGLILLVYEGGLSTSVSAIKAHLFLSTGVATTGICLPVALSFTLSSLAGATPLQAFAAGAALCSTSLGTTFTVLSTSRLTTTRLGTVLMTAAMLDDVVGLIMVQVISNLGKASTFSAVTVVRPVAVSTGLVVALLLFCRFIIKPVASWLHKKSNASTKPTLKPLLQGQTVTFVTHTTILIAMVAGSSYAGTSNLFAAYLAGASISWWDSEISPIPRVESKPFKTTANGATGTSFKHESLAKEEYTPIPPQQKGSQAVPRHANTHANLENKIPSANARTEHRTPVPDPPTTSGVAIYETYYAPAVTRILKPFFFASIGFSIPITRMFDGAIVWRGLVYTLLMLLGKLLTGIWLVRLPTPSFSLPPIPFTHPIRGSKTATSTPNPHSSASKSAKATGKEKARGPQPDILPTPPPTPPPEDRPGPSSAPTRPSNPLSLYPASILGSAMVSRGEIGFLIASVAESEGIFGGEAGSSSVFLIVVWAIMLCTIIGPVSVGLLVRRVRKLQARNGDRGREGVLGVWGVG